MDTPCRKPSDDDAEENNQNQDDQHVPDTEQPEVSTNPNR